MIAATDCLALLVICELRALPILTPRALAVSGGQSISRRWVLRKRGGGAFEFAARQFDYPKSAPCPAIFPRIIFAVWIAGASAARSKIPYFLQHQRGTRVAVTN
ncbi:MAG: hypothetical protein WBF43_03945 [Methylocella sp.]